MEVVRAYAWRNGEIEIAERAPAGAIVFGKGPRETVEQIIGVIARHGYADGVYLVPGIPEAESDDEARQALHVMRREFDKRVNSPLYA